jgi:hypothetical protein
MPVPHVTRTTAHEAQNTASAKLLVELLQETADAFVDSVCASPETVGVGAAAVAACGAAAVRGFCVGRNVYLAVYGLRIELRRAGRLAVVEVGVVMVLRRLIRWWRWDRGVAWMVGWLWQ